MQKRRRVLGLDEILFEQKINKAFSISYYFIQLEGEESLPTMRADGKQNVSGAAGEAI